MKVSVLMPVYNEYKYLAEAVDSVARQAGEDLELELICVDDFSTDGTWDLMLSLQKKYPILKCLRNEIKGKNSAFNLAYRHSSGDAIVLLAGDDKLVDGTIAARVLPLKAEQRACVTLAKYKTFSEKKYLDGIVVPRSDGQGAFSGGTIAFNRSFADSVYPIPEILGNEDMWISCHSKYFDGIKLIHVPIVSLLYRLHENNSLRRDVSFEVKSKMVAKRSMVYGVFLERYRNSLSEDNKAVLARLAALETLRVNRALLSIIFFKNISFVDKLRALVYASPLLHWIHIRVQRWSSGF